MPRTPENPLPPVTGRLDNEMVDPLGVDRESGSDDGDLAEDEGRLTVHHLPDGRCCSSFSSQPPVLRMYSTDAGMASARPNRIRGRQG